MIYLSEDRKAAGIKRKFSFFGNELWKYTRVMRKYEYYCNCKKNKLIRELIHFRFKRLSTKYGFSIPINTFGPGLRIIHRGTVVVNPGATVGANARINCDVVIGAKIGTPDQAPQIGKNCYFAPGAKVFGNITIGDNVIIGANAVVVKDVGDNVSVGGVPARVLSNKSTREIFKYFVD